MFLCSNLLGLFLVAIFILEVQSYCMDESEINPTTYGSTEFKEEGQGYSIKYVFDNFFSGKYLQDMCLSKKNIQFWQLTSSSAKIEKENSFLRDYRDYRSSRYQLDGSMFLESDHNYIRWTGEGTTSEGQSTGFQSGRIYILKIFLDPNDQDIPNSNQNRKVVPPLIPPQHQLGKDKGRSVIVYYGCFDKDPYINENIYITRTTPEGYLPNKNNDDVQGQLKLAVDFVRGFTDDSKPERFVNLKVGCF